MKRVSLDIAKAIKEAGYPQTYEAFYSNNGELQTNMSYEYKTFISKNQIGYSAPTYLEVWLWLWREKNIHIEIIDSKITTQCYATINNEKDTILFNSPEEAIIAAIEYLVDNDLIK